MSTKNESYIRFLGKVPKSCFVACSGGPDSMAALAFLIKGGKDVEVIYCDHGTEFSKTAFFLVEDYCKKNNIKMWTFGPFEEPPKGRSKEEFWRQKRYEAFAKMADPNKPIVIGHNLDDQLENWIFTSAHGTPQLIPYRREDVNAIRPFLLTKKEQLVQWCNKNDVPYLVDPSNSSYEYKRCYIRHEVVKHFLEINPGFYTTIKKKVEKEYNERESIG